MSPLAITGIITLVLLGGMIIFALILIVPMVRLLKKVNKVTTKINKQVLPTIDTFNKVSEKMTEEISSLKHKNERLMELLEEMGYLFGQAKKLNKRYLSNLIITSYDLLSMFRKG